MKTLTAADFNLTPAEMKVLVEGAQKFMSPKADPADDERVNIRPEITDADSTLS